MRTEQLHGWCKFNLFSRICFVLLLCCCRHVKGVVEISYQSGVAPVCQAGDQLELTCSVTGAFLIWKFTVTRESGLAVTSMSDVTSDGPGGVASPVMVNSTTFTFFRLSAHDHSPLISRMTIIPVSEGLNGVEISCIDVAATESAATTIQIVGAGDVVISNFSVEVHSILFTNDNIMLLLKWTVLLSRIYYQHLLQNVSILVVPDPEVTMTHIGNLSVQLTLQYNRQYSVNITQPGICGQPSKISFMELNFSRCRNPKDLVYMDVITEGYVDPALEGEHITFSCRNGLMLNGSESSTCMPNGEWYPDPMEVNCTGPGTTTGSSNTISESMNDVEGDSNEADKFGVVFGVLAVILVIAFIVVLVLALLLKRKGGSFNGPTDDVKIAVAYSVTAFIVGSILFFIIGFLCRHFCRWEKKVTAGTVTEPEKIHAPYYDDIVLKQQQQPELELKENVAYGPVHVMAIQ